MPAPHHKLPDSIRGQVACRSRPGSPAQEHSQAQPARARFLQRFHFAHSHVHAELITFARRSLRVAGARLHGLCDDIGDERFEIDFGFVGWGSRLRHVLKLSNIGRPATCRAVSDNTFGCGRQAHDAAIRGRFACRHVPSNRCCSSCTRGDAEGADLRNRCRSSMRVFAFGGHHDGPCACRSFALAVPVTAAKGRR